MALDLRYNCRGSFAVEALVAVGILVLFLVLLMRLGAYRLAEQQIQAELQRTVWYELYGLPYETSVRGMTVSRTAVRIRADVRHGNHEHLSTSLATGELAR
jgi:hypothetical protein